MQILKMRMRQRGPLPALERCFGAPFTKNHGDITVMVATGVLVGKETQWMIWTGDHQFFFISSILIDFFLVSCRLSTNAK